MAELILTAVFLLVAGAAVAVKLLGWNGAVGALRSLFRRGEETDSRADEPVKLTQGQVKKQLRQLESLHVAGMITEKEYKARKQVLLDNWRGSK